MQFDLKNELDKVINHLTGEYSKLQIGKADISLVDYIEVEAYGVKQNIQSVASINIPNPKEIQIIPWDKSLLAVIEKAIQQGDLNFNPINDGTCVRINIPPLTEERRKEIVKLVAKIAEEAKISIRNNRHKYLKSLEEEGLSEEEMEIEKKNVQNIIDEYNDKIDQIFKHKENDILTV